jgi:hypothetical protein
VIAAYTKPVLLQKVNKGPSLGLTELLAELSDEDRDEVKIQYASRSGQSKRGSKAKRNSVMNI